MKEWWNKIFKKNQTSIVKAGYVPLKKKSFLERDHSIKDSDFKIFTTVRFVVVCIILIIAPFIANLSPFIPSKLSNAVCTSEINNEYTNYSFLEYEVVHLNGEKEKIIYRDDLQEFSLGDQQKLLYLPEEPTKIIFLKADEIYFNFWGAICFGILSIWIFGYVASRD